MSPLFSLLGPLFFLLHSSIAYHQYRELKCSTPTNTTRGGPDRATCHLVFKNEEHENGRPAPAGLGCSKEKSTNGEEREVCDLVCPRAHTVFIAYLDQGHRACFNFFTYQLEKKEEDWFLWRSGKCLNSTATFRIGCKFDDPFETRYKSDKDIFEYLRAKIR